MMKNLFKYLKLSLLALCFGMLVLPVSFVKADGKYDENPATGKPYWYPEDISAFEDFNDYDAPRVVDVADIFTDDEEEKMLEGIKRIQDDFNIDLVVFTDVSSYGLERHIYAADFHQFNGYGFGDDFTGSVLFICMEEGNRGWFTAATGSIEGMYANMDIINYLDDRLEPYMVDGDYGEGVIDYISNVYGLYSKPASDTEGYEKTEPGDIADYYQGEDRPIYNYYTGDFGPTPFPWKGASIGAGIVALIWAAIALSIQKAKMRSIAAQVEAEYYIVPNSFNLTKQRDIFLYKTVRKVRRESSSGSGGRSSGGSYHSSGGRSYSGGGRSF
ncbi:MAG: TPM domain-containing protein [Lachnospiraceae bacterium]|nr:TPM domain-containing protein [Lachnospiraceae bacterium]